MLWQILKIWLLAATPMGLLNWVVFPTQKDSVAIQPEIFFFAMNVAGLMWQVVLSLTILYRATGTLTLWTIRQRTWRQNPWDPKAGQTPGSLWLWLIPIIIVEFVLAMGVEPQISDVWIAIFPYFTDPINLATLAETPELCVRARSWSSCGYSCWWAITGWARNSSSAVCYCAR